MNIIVPLSLEAPSCTSASPIDSAGASSSVIVSVTLCGAAIPCAFVAVPETVASLSRASTSLLTAVIVTSSVLAVAPAAIVNVVFGLSV